MNIALTGASGFIGRALAERLRKAGHAIQPVSMRTPLTSDTLAGCDAVVNLAGEPVAQRWTAGARKRILSSRVEGTRALVNAMRAHPPQ
ncbi:MAG TPA: NAD-dependent epimerase/dehydratase family protein, partial [Bryobacteraceae bacterium]